MLQVLQGLLYTNYEPTSCWLGSVVTLYKMHSQHGPIHGHSRPPAHEHPLGGGQELPVQMPS